MEILNFKNIDLSQIEFDDPKKLKASYICNTNYNDKDLIIQTPILLTQDGIHETETRCHIELYFEKTHVDFYNFMGDVDDLIIDVINKHSSEWFSKPLTQDIIEDLYLSPLKHKSPPKLRVKIPMSRGKIDVPIFDIENSLVKGADVPDECGIVALLKLEGIKFLKEQVICEWVPVQFKICQKIESTTESLIKINDTQEQDIIEEISDNELELEINEYPESDDDEEEISDDDSEPEALAEPAEQQEEIVAELEVTEPVDDMPQEQANASEEIIEVAVNHAPIEPTEVKKNVDDELKMLQSKYSEKESELERLKSALKNFIN
jgi:hypothetical protein